MKNKPSRPRYRLSRRVMKLGRTIHVYLREHEFEDLVSKKKPLRVVVSPVGSKSLGAWAHYYNSKNPVVRKSFRVKNKATIQERRKPMNDAWKEPDVVHVKNIEDPAKYPEYFGDPNDPNPNQINFLDDDQAVSSAILDSKEGILDSAPDGPRAWAKMILATYPTFEYYETLTHDQKIALTTWAVHHSDDEDEDINIPMLLEFLATQPDPLNPEEEDAQMLAEEETETPVFVPDDVDPEVSKLFDHFEKAVQPPEKEVDPNPEIDPDLPDDGEPLDLGEVGLDGPADDILDQLEAELQQVPTDFATEIQKAKIMDGHYYRLQFDVMGDYASLKDIMEAIAFRVASVGGANHNDIVFQMESEVRPGQRSLPMAVVVKNGNGVDPDCNAIAQKLFDDILTNSVIAMNQPTTVDPALMEAADPIVATEVEPFDVQNQQ